MKVSMDNQMSSANLELKMPQASQPQCTSSESLLFNDILQEINTTVRNKLSEFLQVQPYWVFNKEFHNFLERIDCLKQKEQQNGKNISRLTSFRIPSSMSMVSGNRNNTIRQPENNFQYIVSLNPFKPLEPTSLQSNKMVLPSIYECNASQGSSKKCTSIVAVNYGNNNTAKNNDNHEHLNLSESVKHPSAPKNAYSDMTIVDKNKSVSVTHQNENINNGSNSKALLLEDLGFKINVGLPLPDNNMTTKSDANKNNGNLEKYLSKWYVYMVVFKSKNTFVLTGTLLEADQSTIVEEHHNAGFIKYRKKKNLLKTNNGLYCLVGNIIGGSPDELYQQCLFNNGFPVKWRVILNKYSLSDNGAKKEALNFSLDSPAAPVVSVEPAKKPVYHNISMTRTGKIYNLNELTNRKRKELDEVSSKSNTISTNYTKFNRKLPLLTSTPKRQKIQPLMYETPSQILKKKLHCNTKSQALKIIYNTMNVTNQGQCNITEQTARLLRQKSPIKAPQLSSAKCNSTKYLKQMGKYSVLGNVNSKTLDILSTTKISNSSQQKSTALSINSTKSCIKQTPLTYRNVNIVQQIHPVKTLPDI